MKYVFSILIQFGFYSLIFLSLSFFSSFKTIKGGFLILSIGLLFLFMISYLLNSKLFKLKKALLFTVIIFPVIFSFCTIFSINAAMQFGISGRSFSSSFDSYPSGSKPHEGNWTHIIQITGQYRKPFWEKRNIKDLIISIQDSASHSLFYEKHRVIFNYENRKVTWNNFDSIDIYIFDAPVWSDKPIDTIPIVKMKLRYNKSINKFIKVEEKWNNKLIIK